MKIPAPGPRRGQALATFVPALLVYASTCARTVITDDSGELTLAAATLGIAHPPGYPVYTLLGHLFSWLPVGSVAFRLGLMSAVFAALAATFMTLIVAELARLEERPARQRGRKRKRGKKGRRDKKERPHEPKDEPGAAASRLRGALPVAAGLSFAFSLTLWNYAVQAEVYTMTIAFLTGIIFLVLRWHRLRADGGKSGRTLVVAALFLGLGLGVHHSTIVLALPALPWLLLRGGGWRALWSRDTVHDAREPLASALAVLPTHPLARQVLQEYERAGGPPIDGRGTPPPGPQGR